LFFKTKHKGGSRFNELICALTDAAYLRLTITRDATTMRASFIFNCSFKFPKELNNESMSKVQLWIAVAAATVESVVIYLLPDMHKMNS
jgi:hypothetical protein